MLLLELTVRGRHQLESVIQLTRAGFAADGVGPARACFELMMNAYVVYEYRSRPEIVLQNLAAHQRYHRRVQRGARQVADPAAGLGRRARVRERSGAKGRSAEVGSGFTAGDSIFARIRLWTDPEWMASMPDMSPDADPFFPESFPGQLALMYGAFVARANLGMHGVLADYLDRTTLHCSVEDAGGRMLGTVTSSTPRPSLRGGLSPLVLAHFSYDRLVRLLLRHSGQDVELLDSLVGAHWDALTVLEGKVVAKLSRNAICPCGSHGRNGAPLKVKACHGGPQIAVEELERELYHRAWRLYPVFWPDGRPTG